MFTLNEWLDRVGDWNPQLLREIRGRLKFRSLIAVVSISLLIQIVMILFFTQLTPGGVCTGSLRDSCTFIPWERWWTNQFRILSWLMPLILFSNVVYTLVADLLQEEKLGTFNFIRLSPRSSGSILIGKILGVPMLGYITALLFVPYHIVTSIALKTNPFFLLSYYSVVLLMTFLLGSSAVLTACLNSGSTILGNNQTSGLPIVITGMTLLFICPTFIVWNAQSIWRDQCELFLNSTAVNLNLQWFTLPITNNILIAHIFLLFHLGIILTLIWRLLARRFYSPDTTVISKRQSYFLTAYLNILFIGFFVRTEDIFNNNPLVDWLLLGTSYVINWILLVGISLSAATKRQHLLDWSRYGAWRQRNRSGYHLGQLIQDLLWAEKSPATLAMIVNILISQIPLWLFWQVQLRGGYNPNILLFDTPANSVTSLRFWIVQGSLCLTVLIYSLVIQLGKFLKTRNPDTWAVGAVTCLIFLPGIVLRVLSILPEKHPTIWLFFGSPWAALTAIKDPQPVLIAFAAQLLVIGILAALLYAKLAQGSQVMPRDSRIT